jgi:exodeoxyribonuclease V gamma subunit
VLDAVSELATLDLGDDASREVELPVVRDWLEERFGDALSAAGFLSGGMTVAALHPMRVVPHRIVVIAGLDDASFPRSQSRPAFDLLATTRRDGDRDRRADDRQLFLDTLLATGDRLILSCVARSAQTNAARATSVVVAELLDVVDRTFQFDGARVRTLVEVEHRLQPFSPAYFAGGTSSRLFSYSRANARALEALAAGERRGIAPFISGPLPCTGEDDGSREIRLGDLITCWTNPSRFFCEHTLGIHLPGESAPLTECEPMAVDGLDRYTVHDDMLRRHLAGKRVPAQERAAAAALGQLPSGALCGVWFDYLDEELSVLIAALGDVTLDEPVNAEVACGEWTLRGRVDGMTGNGRLQVRPARCKPTDLIRAWILHLALTASFGPTTTEVVATDCRTTFGDVPDATQHLQALVDGYRSAMREPIPFFARASHDYVERAIKLAAGKSRATKSPMDMAREALEGSDYGEYVTGELNEAYASLCWRGRDPLGDTASEFERWATAFWEPAMKAMAGGASE